MGGGLPRKGVGVEKFVPCPEPLFSLGFESWSLGCPGNFAGMSRTAVQKVSAKNVWVHFQPLCKGESLSVLTNFCC